MFRPLEITFHLDGTGIYYDPSEPIMLDSLLSAALCRWHVHGEPPARDEPPFDIPLPIKKWYIADSWGWRASALFPDDASIDSMQYFRKRFRQSRVELTEGSPNLTNGPYREWNMPLPLLLVLRMTAYVFGDRKQIKRTLNRDIKYLGKKRAHGHGAVVSVEVEEIAEDYSLVKDGCATRWIPFESGGRLVRPRPPYWNLIDRVKCCEIGDAISI